MHNEDYIQQVAEAKDNCYDECLAFAKSWLNRQTSVFTSENLIADYLKAGNQPPKEPRVWGAVVQALSRNKLITLVRYEPYKGKAGHGKPSAVWARTNAPVKSWSVPKIVESTKPQDKPQLQLFG